MAVEGSEERMYPLAGGNESQTDSRPQLTGYTGKGDPVALGPSGNQGTQVAGDRTRRAGPIAIPGRDGRDEQYARAAEQTQPRHSHLEASNDVEYAIGLLA